MTSRANLPGVALRVVGRDESEAAARSAYEALLRLRQEAARLALEVGPAPDDEEWSAELAAWHERFRVAADELVTLAGGDAGRLREAIGPVWNSVAPMPAGRALLVSAAITVERDLRHYGERSSPGVNPQPNL